MIEDVQGIREVRIDGEWKKVRRGSFVVGWLGFSGEGVSSKIAQQFPSTPGFAYDSATGEGRIAGPISAIQAFRA